MKKTVSALLWKKAFDSVPRFVMWKVHHRFGCPGHFKYLVQARHDISERVSPTPPKKNCQKNFQSFADYKNMRLAVYVIDSESGRNASKTSRKSRN